LINILVLNFNEIGGFVIRIMFIAIFLTVFLCYCDEESSKNEEGDAPIITNINPSSTSVGDIVTISGKNFGASQGLSKIHFLLADAVEYISWSANEFKVKVPEGSKTGKVYVNVSNGQSNKVDVTIVEWDTALTDNFDSFDNNVWTIAPVFKMGISEHNPNNVIIQNGTLKIILNQVNNTLYSGELRSKQATYHYGRYMVRMRVPVGAGIISSFYLYEDNSTYDNHFNEELDIEFLGRYFSSIWKNYGFISGSNPRIEYPGLFELATPFGDGLFHTYCIEWDEKYIKWFMDGEQIGTTATVNIPSRNMKIMMNIWANDANVPNSWQEPGSLNVNNLPVFVEYDWVKVLNRK
jgi:hypothetical protein